jgi:hypothetical protein
VLSGQQDAYKKRIVHLAKTKENVKTATDLKAKIVNVRTQIARLEREKQELQAAEIIGAFTLIDSEHGDSESEEDENARQFPLQRVLEKNSTHESY